MASAEERRKGQWINDYRSGCRRDSEQIEDLLVSAPNLSVNKIITLYMTTKSR
jgi:hypothetical protein